MRMKLPTHISKLLDVFGPYLYLDKSEWQMQLKADAPAEAVQAKKEYDEWSAQHKFRMEGCDG